MAPTHEEIVGDFKPGSVTRIKLINFLTYSQVEFHPGPRLNLVCGPNGTGKSTILNAMCLGLGGEPKHLGRADDAREFISHGADKALIEIEVMHFPGKDKHVFRRTIDRNKGSEKGRGRGASTFFINGEQTNIKKIQEIVSEVYHISIDNLCTFLPQDRVGSFSGFNSKQLLEETEKSLSASQHLYDTHLQLIRLEAELNQGGNSVETMEKKLKKLEADFSNIEREKERMEERQVALEQVELLEKKILWLRYDHQREQCLQLKKRKDETKQKLTEAKKRLDPMEQEAAELEFKLHQHRARFQTYDGETQAARQEMTKQMNKYETHSGEIDTEILNLQTVDELKKTAEHQLEEARTKLEDLRTRLENMPSLDELNEEVRRERAEISRVQQPLRQKSQQLQRLTEEMKQVEEQIRVYQNNLNKLNDIKQARRNRVFQAFPNLKQISEIVHANRKRFRKPVWGPVACEVEMKTKTAAPALEQHVPNSVWKSFVVECKEDYDMLYKIVRQDMKLPINILTVKNGKLEDFERIYSERKYETLRRDHGVIGYLDESFLAPDPIRQALIDEAMVERVLVGGEKTQESLDKRNLVDFLSKPEEGSSRLKASCVFATNGDKMMKYASSISRYSNTPSVRIDDVAAARFLDAGVNPERKEKAGKDLKEAQENADTLKKHIEELQRDVDEFTRLYQEAKARGEAAKTKIEASKKAEKIVAKQEQKVIELEDKASADNSEEKKKLVKQVKARVKNAISALEAHAAAHRKMMSVTYKSAGTKINEAIVDNESRTILYQLRSAREEFNQLEKDATIATNMLKEAKTVMNNTLAECNERAPLTDANKESLPLKAKLEALPVETIEEAEAALDEQQAKANTIDDNPDVALQYEKLKAEIVETKDELENLADTKEAKQTDIDRLKAPWENALQNSLEKVNVLFAKYMAELGCAGQIVLTRGDAVVAPSQEDKTAQAASNFDQWGVEIQVKFREKAKMAVLSAQRHSGGERSVSTIMYLMALQELMVSPFRCVDEINQGLDERNERLVFKRIVENSTKPPRRGDLANHSGQYFLITPKLLPNLYDMEEEAVTVHVITNGPYTFKTPLDWNPDHFVNLRSQGEAAGKQNDENSPDIANNRADLSATDADAATKRKKRRVS